MESESWTNNRVIELIEDIKEHRVLWDPKDVYYKSKTKKFDCFKNLSIKYQCTVDEIKKKWTNLLQVYRSCRRKIKCTSKSGAGRDEVYKPLCFAYDYMNTFMADVYVPHGISDSVNEEKENDNNEEAVINKENMEKGRANADRNETSEISDDQQFMKNICSSPKTMEIKKRRRQSQATIDERAEEAYAYLVKKRKEGTIDKKQKDECDIFAELIAVKLKKLDNYSRQFVMNDINNIIFKATMNTRILQKSENINFVHSPQEFIDHSYSQSSSLSSHSSLLSPVTIITEPTINKSNEVQILAAFSDSNRNIS